jgi:hypothetical protein
MIPIAAAGNIFAFKDDAVAARIIFNGVFNGINDIKGAGINDTNINN